MKKPSRSKIIKKLDAVFSQFIRLRDSNNKWIVECPLCWSKIPRKKAQNMHFVSRWNMKYRYDEINCNAWCMRCNVILNGNYIIYTRWMIRKYWLDKVDEMIFDKQPFKIRTYELEAMIEYYMEKVKELMKEKHLSS